MIWWGIVALVVVAVTAFLLGRAHAQRGQARDDVESKDRQLQAAADRPAGKRDLADRVRDHF